MSGRLRIPDPETKRKWGPLAYVSEEERRRIMDLPSGQSKRAITSLEREIDAFLKRASGGLR